MQKRVWILWFLLGLILVGGMGLTYGNVTRADKAMRSHLIEQARIMVSALDIPRVQALSGTEADLIKPDYVRLKSQFVALCAANPQFRFMYLLGRHSDGTVYLFVDNEPTDSEDYAPPGNTYEEAPGAVHEVYQTGVEKAVGPYTDRWGRWISALAPVWDPNTDAIIAVLGLDIDASMWRRMLLRGAVHNVLFTLALAAIVLFGNALLVRRAKIEGAPPHWMWRIEPAIAAAAGLLVTFFVAITAHHADVQSRSKAFTQLATVRTDAIAKTMRDLRDTELESLARFYEGSQEVTREQFQRFTQYLTSNPAVHAWQWAPAVLAAERAAFEAAIQASGLPYFEIWEQDEQGNPVSAGERDTYYPVLQVAPLPGNETVLGYDLGSEPKRRDALEEAARTGLATATKTITLVQEQEEQKGMLVVRPVHLENSERLSGFAVASLRLETLLRRASSDKSAFLELLLLHEDGRTESLATTWDANGSRDTTLYQTRPVLLFGQTFAVTCYAGPEFISYYPPWRGFLAALSCLALTGLLVVVISMFLNRREELERLLLDRTEALRRSEQHFRNIYEQSTLCYHSLDAEGRILDVNPAWTRATGYTREEVLGSSLKTFFLEPSRLAFEERFSQFRVEGRAHNAEFQLRHKDGSRRTMVVDGVFVYDDTGNPSHTHCVLYDVTERKQAEERLKKSEERYRRLVDLLNEGIWEVDAAARTTFVNPAMAQMLGYTRDEMLGRSLYDFMDEDGKRVAMANMAQRSGHVDAQHEFTFRRKDGAPLPTFLSTTAIMDCEGNFRGALAGISDISALKAAETELRQRENVLQKMIEMLPVGVWFADRNGKLLRGNPAGIAIWGAETLASMEEYGVFKARRLPSGEEVAPDDWALARTIRDGVTIVDEQLEIETFDGKKKVIVNYTVPILDDRGELMGAVVLNQDITRQTRAQEALRESEEEHRALVACLPDIIMRFDRDGRHLFVSANVSEVFDAVPDDFLGKTHRELGFTEPHCHFWEQNIRQVFDHGTFVETEFTATGKKGPVTFNWRLVPEHDQQGSIRSVLSIARDITAHRQAEQNYRRLFQEMFEGFAVHELIVDERGKPADYRFLNVNPAFERMTGLKAADILGKTVLEVLPQTEPYWIETYGGVALTGTPVFFEQYAEALQKHYEVRAFQTEPNRFACTFIDITERKHAERALRDSEMTYRAIAENAVDRIWQADMNLVFTYMNPTRTPDIAFTPEEVVGHSMAEFVSPGEFERFSKMLAEEVSKGPGLQGVRVETEGLTRTGALEQMEVRAVVMFDEEGRPTGIQGMTRDITERKKAEVERERLQSQLLQAQKMESVGRLAGGVAHDFNNMLGVILGNTEIALEQVAPDAPLSYELQEIRKAAERSAALTRQLLAFARKQTIAPKVLDLNETVEEMLKMLRRLIGENITLSWLPAADVWQVKMDPAQIDQILANLCVNSRDAIAGVGRVTIETGNTVLDNDYCANHPGVVPGDYVMLTVSDTGCGMNYETLQSVFEPFFTTKHMGEGTGLGLATVYGIVKQNKGFIHAYSESGLGATFKVYLPRYRAQHASDDHDTIATAPCGGNETILLVEDEPPILRMVAMMLEKHGYTVLTAATPEEAVRLAEADGQSIDLLMTDVIMPGMNGRDLARKLQTTYPGLKCLFMSGYTADVIAHHGILESDVHFIQKPFSILELTASVREALERRE